ncbi:MAG: RdgB/HAM1 family non-canonical purine NTP pyrophosphatase [Rhodanobacteraceae bacterium]
MRKIVLASGNSGKLAEMRTILAGFASDLVAQSDLDIADIDESGTTFVENALLKARHAARTSGLPALADDSGLCVDALDGAPGLLSARYAGPHGDAAANIAKLLDALRDVRAPERGACFYCCAVLLRSATDPTPLIAEGCWEGSILEQPRGGRGFGYDPVFLDRESGLSAAELDPAAKNRVSHRARALVCLRERLSAGAVA